MSVSTLLGTLMSPVRVAIVDTETNKKILSKMKVISVVIDSPAEITAKPIQASRVSSGVGDRQGESDIASDLSQAKVISPATAEVEGAIDDSDTILDLIKYHDTSESMFDLYVKSAYVRGMVITGVEIRYDSEHINVAMVRISFEQAIPVPYIQSAEMEQDADSPSYGFGVQQLTTISDTVSNLYDTIVNKAKAIL